MVTDTDALQKGLASGLSQLFIQLRLSHKEDIDQLFVCRLHV